MSYLPTQAAGKALLQLRKMIAQSASFQAAVGVDTEAEAKALVFVGRKDGDFPKGAVVYLEGQPVSFETYAGGDQNHLKPTGMISCILRFPVVAADDLETRYLKGIDAVCGTAQEVANKSNADNPQGEFGLNHLDAVRIDVTYGSLANPGYDNSRGLVFSGKLMVNWGDGV